MGSKALFILAMFLAITLLISAEVPPKDFDEKFHERDGKLSTNGIEESKYWGYGGPWYGGYGYGGPWGYGGYGWGRGYGWGGCGLYGCYPRKRAEVRSDAKPHN